MDSVSWTSVEEKNPPGVGDYLCVTGKELNVLYFNGASFEPARETMVAFSDLGNVILLETPSYWAHLPPFPCF